MSAISVTRVFRLGECWVIKVVGSFLDMDDVMAFVIEQSKHHTLLNQFTASIPDEKRFVFVREFCFFNDAYIAYRNIFIGPPPISKICAALTQCNAETPRRILNHKVALTCYRPVPPPPPSPPPPSSLTGSNYQTPDSRSAALTNAIPSGFAQTRTRQNTGSSPFLSRSKRPSDDPRGTKGQTLSITFERKGGCSRDVKDREDSAEYVEDAEDDAGTRVGHDGW